MADNHSKVGFLVSQFPEMHETFILREFLGFRNAGFDFEIYSYKECRDEIVHPQTKDLIDRVHYAPRFELGSLAYWIARRPLGCATAYVRHVAKRLTRPVDFVKANGVFIRSMAFARLMEQRGIKHVHSHWASMPTTGAQIIAELLGTSFSFTAHAWDIFLTSRAELTSKIREASFVVTCTAYNRTYLHELGGEAREKVFLNYHGMDLEYFSPRPPRRDGDHVILAIGRLVEQKGFEYLVEACSLLKEQGLRIRCVIVGDGPLRGKLEALIACRSLHGIVELEGKMTQAAIRDLFHSASAFVMPSVVASDGDRDGIPNVLLEALATGVPTISTNVSGIPEVVVNGVTGLLVPPRDERALTEALATVLRGEGDCEVWARNGRELILKHFDLDKNVGELIKLFEEKV